MRSIVGASLKSRLLVVALAAGLLVVGIIQLRTMPVDVLPEFNAPSVEVQTEALGLSAEEVEQLITTWDGAGFAQRGAVAQDHPLQVGSRALLDPHDLRSRHRPRPGTADGDRAHGPGVCAAARVETADHAPAHVVDRPGHDDRAVLEGCVPDPDGGAGALDDCAALDGRARRGQCGDLGPARSAAAGASRSETVARSTCFAAASPRNHRATRCGYRR